MTIAEMHQRFKYYTSTVFNNTYQDFEPEEIDLALNDYQMTFIKQRYGNNNMTRESVEETQKRTDDLRMLVTFQTLALAVPGAGRPNTVVAQLPPAYMFSLSEIAEISYGGCASRRVPVEVITHDELSTTLFNKYKKPNRRKCLRLMEGDDIVVFHDAGVVVLNYELSYITEPSAMDFLNSVDCVLPVHTHDEIVKGAAQIATSLVGDARKPPSNLTTIQE